MDLNQLFWNQQIALMNASVSTNMSARMAHTARARLYGDHITAYRAGSVQTAASANEDWVSA